MTSLIVPALVSAVLLGNNLAAAAEPLNCVAVQGRPGSSTVEVVLAVPKAVDAAARTGTNWLLRVTFIYVSTDNTVEVWNSGLKSIVLNTLLIGYIDSDTAAVRLNVSLVGMPPLGDINSSVCSAELAGTSPYLLTQASTSPHADRYPMVANLWRGGHHTVAWTSFDGSSNWDIYTYSPPFNGTVAVTRSGTAAGPPSLDDMNVVFSDHEWRCCETLPFNIFGYVTAPRQLTNGAFNQLNPVVAGDYVVWEDYRNGAANPDLYGAVLSGGPRHPRPDGMWDPLTAGPEFPVNINPAAQHNLAMSKEVLVWQDERNETPNIYSADLTSPGIELPIAAGARDAQTPDIDNGRIVYSELVGSYRQIFLYDLNTHTALRLSPSSSNQTSPKISGRLVIWQDDRNRATSGIDIYGFDLTADAEFQVETDPLDQTDIDVSGLDVVFTDERNGNHDVFYLLLPQYDSTAPTIGMQSPADGAVYLLNEVVYAGYRCDDELGGSLMASCIGDVFTGTALDTTVAGDKTFTVVARDNAGNTTTVTRHYSVVGYTVSGFMAPVNNAPTVNTGKAGRAYSVRWQLRDSGGSFVNALSAVARVVAQPTTCEAFTNEPTDALETTAAGGAGLRYDAASNSYIYNWATPQPGCYTLFVILDSGQSVKAYFKLS